MNNLPDNAGDTGSIPAPGRSHVPQSHKAHVPQLLKLCRRAQEPQRLSPLTLEPALHNKRRHHNEKDTHAIRRSPSSR